MQGEDVKSCVLFIPMSLCYYSGMTSRRRLYVYVLLNVLVSACVVLTFIYLYDRYFRSSPTIDLPPLGTPSSGNQARDALDIVSVVGAGVLENEAVEIRNHGDGEVDLTGWKLQTADGRTYTFPRLSLLKGGFVNVHSGNGKNTVVDLYWGLSRAAWESGQLAILLDSGDSVQALYRIP
jgi:hypothetical protein